MALSRPDTLGGDVGGDVGRGVASPAMFAAVVVARLAIAVGIAVVAGACSGAAKPVPKDAAGSAAVPVAADARPAIDAPKGPPTTGDARIRLEWVAVPVAARVSGGKTVCGAPRAPSVHPTTTWGVPEAFVILDGEPPDAAQTARVELGGCALAPGVAIAGALAIVSAAETPASVAFGRAGDASALAAIAGAPAGASRTIAMLPIAGHAVTSPLDAGGVYAVDADGELAWIVAGRGAITDASGVALLHDLPPGSHAITGWLPPRAGQPGRIAQARVVIVVGDVVDATLTLTLALASPTSPTSPTSSPTSPRSPKSPPNGAKSP